jgi:hypothetical protein
MLPRHGVGDRDSGASDNGGRVGLQNKRMENRVEALLDIL